jgi:hypothetical protein
VASHEHNLLPFSTPQSYALFSAESKATEAANNKERLDECHNNVWSHTILAKISGAERTRCSNARVIRRPAGCDLQQLVKES